MVANERQITFRSSRIRQRTKVDILLVECLIFLSSSTWSTLKSFFRRLPNAIEMVVSVVSFVIYLTWVVKHGKLANQAWKLWVCLDNVFLNRFIFPICDWDKILHVLFCEITVQSEAPVKTVHNRSSNSLTDVYYWLICRFCTFISRLLYSLFAVMLTGVRRNPIKKVKESVC